MPASYYDVSRHNILCHPLVTMLLPVCTNLVYTVVRFLSKALCVSAFLVTTLYLIMNKTVISTQTNK